jgi:outer membrane protein TolC
MGLKAANKDIEAAQGRLTEAKAAFWPVLEYKYRMAPVPTDVDDAWNSFWSGEVTFFNSIHVGIGVPITAFGQLHMARRLAQGGVEAARIRTRQAESDVVFTVKKIYYGIQLAKESIKLLNEAIGKLDKKIKSEEERAEEEDGEEEEDELADVNDHLDPYDVLHMRAFKSELERRREEAKQNLELAYDAMRIQLDLHPGAEIGLDSDCLKPKLASLDKEEEFIEGGMKHGHNVNLLDIGVETKRRLYKLEKFKLAPKFGFGFFMDAGRSIGEIRGLQLTDDYNDPFNYTRAGFGFQLQGTIDFHGAYGRIKKSRAEYHKAVYQRIIARRALTMDIRKVYLYAKRAKLNVGRTKKEWSMANQMMFRTSRRSSTTTWPWPSSRRGWDARGMRSMCRPPTSTSSRPSGTTATVRRRRAAGSRSTRRTTLTAYRQRTEG